MSSAIAVAPPSMLRGKTIEEIVNRWSSELETHVKEFNKFAGEVAVWDRALIENSKNVRNARFNVPFHLCYHPDRDSSQPCVYSGKGTKRHQSVARPY